MGPPTLTDVIMQFARDDEIEYTESDSEDSEREFDSE